MDVLNAKVWEKYQNLKKRKASEAEEMRAEIEEKVRKYQNASEEMVEVLRNENDELRYQIFLKEEEFAKSQALLMEERRKSKELSSEVERLHNQIVLKNYSLDEKACDEPACCKLMIAASGGMSDSCAEKCVFHSLLESIVGLRFSIEGKADVLHFSVAHQPSGYSFKLTWSPRSPTDGGEWFYQVSSLGTLERVALGWMKEDIMFSSTMFPLFFQRISRALGRIQ